MSWRVVGLLGLVAATVLGSGCSRKNPPPVPKAAVKQPPSQDKADAKTAQSAVPPKEELANSAMNDAAASTATKLVDNAKDPDTNAAGKDAEADLSKSAETQVDKPADKPPAPPERIAVLAPGGPLIIDITLTLDGEAHGDKFAARIKQVVGAGDSNHDGNATWEELAANEEYLKTQNGPAPDTAKARAKAWTDSFDFNRDKRIQPGEAAAWLGRDAGRSIEALSLRSRRSYYSVAALGSRVWQLLDGDNDGKLSNDELATSPDRFFLLDANDDRIITAPELAPLREQLNDMGMGRPAPNVSRSEDRYAALHLEPDGDAGRLEYLLADLYAPRQPLSPESFRDLPRLFQQLDGDADGRLDQLEVARLLTIKPHVELDVTFEKPAAPNQRGAARVEVRAHDSEVELVAQPAASRVVLALGNTRLIVTANDLGAAGPAERAAERDAARVMVHDDFDALFQDLDRNADGRLGEREVNTAAERMMARDKNADGRISSDELPTAMVVAFLRSEPQANQSFYIPEDIPEPAANSQAPAWFTQADFNGDGDVSRREFLGSLEQFEKLDENHDHFISASETSSVNPPLEQLEHSALKSVGPEEASK